MTESAERIANHSSEVAELINPAGQSPVLLVCEHASNHIPEEFGGLGLDGDARQSHVAWDPGAYEVALEMSRLMDAPLVVSNVSRLVYDCNRPPGAPDAMPARSELFDIPGNAGLDAAERARRVSAFYDPFRRLVASTLDATNAPQALVTVHSFTPIYMGKRRDTELGILHDTDSRMADEILRLAPEICRMEARRNQPYGPQDGVTHTLKQHGLRRGIANVMLEIRNDLIRDDAQQNRAAERLTSLIQTALERMNIPVRERARQ